MADDIVQVIQDAREDAVSLSQFIYYPASTMVERRLAPSIHTLNYYLDYLHGLELIYSQPTGTVIVNGEEIKTVRQAINDSVDSVILGDYQAQLEVEVDGEVTRATSRENEIEGALEAEVARATDAEGVISQDLSDLTLEVDAQKLDTGITVTALTGGEPMSLSLFNSLVITPERFGARMLPNQDDAPAFRKAIAYLESIGGGVLSLNAVKYNLKSVVEKTGYYTTGASSGKLIPVVTKAPFFVPAKVSLIGAGRDLTSLDVTKIDPYGINHGISLVEYSDGVISGFSLLGSGMSGSTHGIHLSLLKSAKNHINKNIKFSDLRIKNFSAYGLGHQYGAPYNIILENIIVETSGSDCIDFKVRFGGEPSQDIAAGVFMNNIIARNPDSKGTGNASGIGLRGKAILSNIEVTGVPLGAEGITLVAGIANGDEFRQPAYRSVLTNFYIEGADPDNGVVGLNLYSCGAVAVSNGYVRNSRVLVAKATASPTEFVGGGSLDNVIVERAGKNRSSFTIEVESTHLNNCRSLSGVDYYEAKRNNLVAGQTTLIGKFAYPNDAVVIKNGTTLTKGAAYTITSGDTGAVVLNTAAASSDVIQVITPTYRALRIEAPYCSINGGGSDRWHQTFGGSVPNSTVEDNTSINGFYIEGKSMMSEMLLDAAILKAQSPSANEDLRILPKGTGYVRLGSATTATADSAVTGYIKIKDTTGAIRKLAIID